VDVLGGFRDRQFYEGNVVHLIGGGRKDGCGKDQLQYENKVNAKDTNLQCFKLKFPYFYFLFTYEGRAHREEF